MNDGKRNIMEQFENSKKPGASASPVQTIVMQDLPFGMTQVPLGWGMMTGAFMSFASFALDSKKIKEQYFEQTNVNLMEFENQSILEQMIDNSTGYAESALGMFLDWLAINHWGLEGGNEKKAKPMSDSVTNRIKKGLYDWLQPFSDDIGKPEDIELTHSIIDDLGADSLDLVELVMAFEEEFDIELEDVEAEKLLTVEDVIKFVNAEIKA